MTVASCPSCRESVTVPIDALPESIVRCPLCHEEFRLEEFLSQLPPPLIVLNEGGPATHDVQVEESDNVFSSSMLDRSTTESTDGPDTSDSAVPAFDFTPGSVETESSDVQLEGARRPSRRQKNPTWEVAKIVGGALLAVPAAQVILWWFVPGDWKRDLLGIGPPVSRVVPWIVPEPFRATPTVEMDEPAARPRSDVNPGIQRRTAEGNRDRKSTMPSPGSGQRDTRTNVPSKPGTATPNQRKSVAPAADNEPNEPDAKEDVAKAKSDPVPDAKTPEGKTTDPDVPPDTASPPPKSAAPGKQVPGVKNAREYGFDDLRDALQAALIASAAWDTTPDQSREQQELLSEQFYRDFAKLGETVTFIRPGDDRFRELVGTLQDLLHSFGRQPKKLAMIGNRSTDWWDRADRPSRGIILFGTVTQISRQGQVFRTDLDLGAIEKRGVTIISRVDPEDFYSPSDRILMLGAIIDDPAENLIGYEGNLPRVVMGGFGVPLKF